MDDLTSNPQVPEHSVVARQLIALPDNDDDAFSAFARRVFAFQRKANPTYRVYAEGAKWTTWVAVPFLPAEAFKWPGISCFEEEFAEALFLSSATGGPQSRHPIHSLALYEAVSATGFEREFGQGPFDFVAHLPSYERAGGESSLLHMVKNLMSRFGSDTSTFVTDRLDLSEALTRSGQDQPLVLFGTAFGLLEFVEANPTILPRRSLVIETGGMKSKRRTISRAALHEALAIGFGVDRTAIRSEYGMCELLSQCYTRGGTVFYPPRWMRFKIVAVDEPERELDPGVPGALALFDLANIYTVSAVLTADLAVQRGSGFEVLGRITGAELRGCNFLMPGAA